jgi:SAM-dependent methyltransferase
MVHLTRYYMYKRISECFQERINGKILGISGIKNFYPLIDMKKSEVVDVQYPEVDMQKLPFQNETFDYVISDQVIEHLQNPQQAIKESYRVLKNGGVAIHTTCLLLPIHYGPKDYWRFTPDALSYLCRNFSEIQQSEGWGNKLAHLLCTLSTKIQFLAIPESKWSIRRWFASRNDPNYPILTWIVAKK